MIRNVVKGFALFSVCLVFGCSAPRKHSSGNLTGIVGSASIFTLSDSQWHPARIGMQLRPGDSAQTDKESFLEIRFSDNVVKLGEETRICIADTMDSAGVHVLKIFNACGEVLSDIRKLTSNTGYEVHTPTSVAAVRGTHFVVRYIPFSRTAHVNVLSGKVLVLNPLVPGILPLILLPGFFTEVAWRKHPAVPVKLNYGQLKKMERLIGPPSFRRYNRKFKPKHVPGLMMPVPGAMLPVPGKSHKKGSIRNPGLPTVLLPVPLPGVPAKPEKHKDAKGKKGKGKPKK